MNSVSSDAPSGWYPDKEKYPEGWSKVRALAKEKGITLGLWAAWVVSDKELIDNQRDGGFQYFKIDFAVLDTYEKIERLINNSRRVIEYSEFKARINWDVTENPPRMGYYFGRDLGNIYLENRKPQKPQNVVYVPYLVLRDAWQVAKYLKLNKFQVPVQNIDMVNHDLSNAFQYNHSYCVAIAFMGAPIFFQETQHLDENARSQIRPLIALYKKYRREMFEGYVFPIGDKPDDASWTGFQCHVPHRNAGYITLFRELNNKEASKEIKLKFLQDKKLKLTELISENESIETVCSDGIVTFKINRHAGFLYLRYEVIED